MGSDALCLHERNFKAITQDHELPNGHRNGNTSPLGEGGEKKVGNMHVKICLPHKWIDTNQ
jgi:hypothetical protein